MLVLRSVAFNLLFYLNLVLHLVAAIPTFALPRATFMRLAKSWGRTSNAVSYTHLTLPTTERV